MPSKNNLSALKSPARESILPSAEPSTEITPAKVRNERPVTRKAKAVGRPPKPKAEKRDYKITLSLTKDQGHKIKAKAGIASEAALIYDYLEKTGFFE